jgi:hypothetical protein
MFLGELCVCIFSTGLQLSLSASTRRRALKGALAKHFFAQHTRSLWGPHVLDGIRASERFELEKDNVSGFLAGKQS